MIENAAERAETVAEMAPSNSVTTAVLAGHESRFSESPPLNNPPLTYLAGAEAPAYLLTNGKRGIGRGTKRKTDKSVLTAAAEFIEDHTQDSPDSIDGDDTANRVMYRGRPVVSQDTTADKTESDQTTYYRGQPIDDDSD